MNFDPNERTILGHLADVLIPAGEGFPAASAAGVTGSGLDQVLAVRPELTERLKALLRRAKDQEPHAFIAHLKQSDPEAFGILAELVPGAYFLDPEVRAKLKYEGQTPRPIDPQADYLEDGLLQSVIDRGPVYRPTPPA